MKAQILKTLAALALITTSAAAQETPMENHTASYIAMPAAEGQTEAFAEFLAGAAPIVADTEPGTCLLYTSCLWPRRLVPITKSRNSSRNFKAVDGYRNEAAVCWNCRGWQNHRA